MSQRSFARLTLILGSACAFAPIADVEARQAAAGAKPSFVRHEDVIYGRKHGTALTLDVFKPAGPSNGRGLIYVVSGGWFSAHQAISSAFVEPFTKRGYTVFAVVHGSQPKFTIPEILDDLHRAVRFIKSRAGEYEIDPDRLGIYGGSAGGHLSLMQGTAGKAADPAAKDPIDRQSSRVASVACFYPPTDFFNYGKDGQDALGRGILAGFGAPFDFQQLNDETKRFDDVVDEAKLQEIGKAIAPYYHVSRDDAPTLIIHGDADTLVPIQQAERIVERMKAEGVKCELVVKPGQGHGWPKLVDDLEKFADWFDATLAPAKKDASERKP
ncbi:MAG: alpha/beta hydrolase [Isosphaeraceae bacterium]|nr:alpha/beta hydrolase [Isosphaeraceae bacterium]